MIKPENWQAADNLVLEPNALQAAIEQVSSLALTAGPGAGKTEMLAQRADFLLRTGTCPYPKRILAISFKVDASRNLKERVKRRSGSSLSSRFDSYTFHAFAKRIIDRFRLVLVGVDALDADYQIGDKRVTRRQIEFNDLVPLAITILESSQVARNAVRQTYSDVFLDEFQDCTTLQYRLVKLAFQGTSIRLIAVGDTKQKIMAWAGALEGIFSTFADDFSARPLNLYRNFRSQAKLLRMQNEIIRILDPVAVMPDELIVGDEGEIYAWGYHNSQEEALHVAEQIECWVNDEGVPYSEIAILVSKQPDLYADLLMAELENRDIPFRNEQQLQDLSVEPVARLIVDYLLCLFGEREPKAWVRLMDLLIPFSEEDGEAVIRQDWQRFVKSEQKTINDLEQLDNSFSSRWIFAINFLKKIGISNLTSLSPDYESRTRLFDVIKETNTRIKEQFEREQDLLKALMRFSDDKAVRILTIHKSKGLEFDTVIILGVENETFWGKVDDERCAFFVAVSRAKHRLVMTVSKTRDTPPSNPWRWDVARSVHAEFIGYAKPFLK